MGVFRGRRTRTTIRHRTFHRVYLVATLSRLRLVERLSRLSGTVKGNRVRVAVTCLRGMNSDRWTIAGRTVDEDRMQNMRPPLSSPAIVHRLIPESFRPCPRVSWFAKRKFTSPHCNRCKAHPCLAPRGRGGRCRASRPAQSGCRTPWLRRWGRSRSPAWQTPRRST